MESFEIIANAVIGLLEALAWPVAVVIIAFLFRKELREAFRRLSRLKYRGLEADFGRELEKAEEEAESGVLPSVTEERQLLEGPTDVSHFLDVAEVSPQAAVLVAWPEVEEAVWKASERIGLDIPQRTPPFRLMRFMVEKEAITPEMRGLYNRLRRLRNEAAHAQDFEISTDEAERYVQLVDRLTGYLNNLEKR